MKIYVLLSEEIYIYITLTLNVFSYHRLHTIYMETFCKKKKTVHV